MGHGKRDTGHWTCTHWDTGHRQWTWTRHGRMDAWTHGHMDTCTDGRMDIWTHVQMYTLDMGYWTWIHVHCTCIQVTVKPLQQSTFTFLLLISKVVPVFSQNPVYFFFTGVHGYA